LTKNEEFKAEPLTRGVSNVGDAMTSSQQNPHGRALTADDDAAPRHPPLLTTPSRCAQAKKTRQIEKFAA